MFFSNVSIRRPVFTCMMNLLIIIFGLIGYSKIGVDENPKVDLPYVSIRVQVPGAPPSFIEENVLNPIEKQMKTIEGISNIFSTINSDGSVVISLEFVLDHDVTKATNDVRNTLTVVTGRKSWPKNALPPSVKPVNPNSGALMSVALYTKDPNVTFGELSEFANDELVPKIEQVQGVGDVNVVGMRLPEFDIYFDSQKLSALGISASQVVNQIQNEIISIPGGSITDGKTKYDIDISTTPMTVDQLASVLIQTKNNQLIQLKQIADVVKTIQPMTSYGELNGKPSLILWVEKSSDGNTVQAAENVRNAIYKIKEQEKGKIEIQIINDTSRFISNSIDAVKWDIFLGALLTILIVYLFLQEVSTTLLSAIAIPTSIIGTLFVMNALHFTLNQMTTLALSLCIGIIVDDSIVVIENIHRHLQMGKRAYEATMDAMKEIGVPAIVITIAIVAVFLPVAFMEGIIGRFFYEFSITVSCSVLISLFVAVTLTPSIGSRILKVHSPSDRKLKFFVIFNEYFEKLENFYAKLVEMSLHRRWTTLFIGLGILAVSLFLFHFVPTSFNVPTDKSYFMVSMDLNPNSGIEETILRGREVTQWLEKTPGVRSVFMRISNNNTARFIVNLVPPENRNYTQNQLQIKLRKDLQQFKRDSSEIFAIGKPGSKQQPVQVIISHKDPVKLHEFTLKLQKYIASLPEIDDVITDVPSLAKKIKVNPNAVMANSLGISNLEIANTLSYLFDGATVGSINENDIVLKLKESQTKNISDIFNVSVHNSSGAIIPLSNIVKLSISQENSMIQHFNGEREESVLAEYNGKDLGNILKMADAYIRDNAILGMNYQFSGESKYLKDSGSAVFKVLLMSFIFAYMVLCSQFESLLTPFVIILSVPLAFSGAFIFLLLFNKSMTFFAMVGFILLTGLVKKNAILLLDFAEKGMKNDNLSVHESLIRSGKVRLRPILMTSFAMIFGMFPMTFSSGLGHEARSPMGVVVIGGIISSTILTLIVIPCVYSLLYDLKNIFRRREILKQPKDMGHLQ